MFIKPFVRDVIKFNIYAHNRLGPYQLTCQLKSVNSLAWKSNYFRVHILQGRVLITIDGTATYVPLSVPISKAS